MNIVTGKLSGQQIKVGGSGMKGFYGSPTENKLGIVGKVAKAPVKELTGKEGEVGETKIVDKDTPSIFNRYNQKNHPPPPKQVRVREK